VEPKVIRVEDFEFANRLEFFQVLRGYLGDFEKANRTLIINEGATLSGEILMGSIGSKYQTLP
jgi:hypothetical protein